MTAEIRLPERLDRSALSAFRSDVERLAGEPVAVLSGAAEGAFCRGLALESLDVLDACERSAGLADFEQAVMTLVTSSTRTVARVDGDVLGGGLGIASACDVVVASERARFGLPEPVFGLIPGLVLPLIRSRAGGPAVRRLALASETVDALEARRLGLVDEIAPAQALDGVVRRWVRRLARVESGAAGRLKRWLADMDDLAAEVARGRAHLQELLGSDVVARRVGRYRDGFTPWEDEGGAG